MKKLGGILFVMVSITVLFCGCNKKAETTNEKKGQEVTFQEKLQKCAEEYVKTELNINDANSVMISRIDTLTKMSYAKLMLEMLENMEYQYKRLYDEATLADDDANIATYGNSLQRISKQINYFRSIDDNESADNTQLLLYWISGSYNRNGQKEDFMCFVTPDFTLHVLDPFADNLMEN